MHRLERQNLHVRNFSRRYFPVPIKVHEVAQPGNVMRYDHLSARGFQGRWTNSAHAFAGWYIDLHTNTARVFPWQAGRTTRIAPSEPSEDL